MLSSLTRMLAWMKHMSVMKGSAQCHVDGRGDKAWHTSAGSAVTSVTKICPDPDRTVMVTEQECAASHDVLIVLCNT